MDGLSLNIKGYVEVALRDARTLELKAESNQPNLVVPNGRKILLTPFSNPYLYLSSFTGPVTRSLTTVPNSLTYSSVASGDILAKVTGTTFSKRYRNQFGAPTSTRTIYSVALAYSTSSGNLVAMTTLLTPIEQTVNDIVDVYYTIIMSPYTA
ncbi:MAG: hypothetical protein LHW56_01690 [Candidatus Cloacimonetes bacterium]|nr:hypothetical protein [Candidatus Cloacimonadota bacterium]MDY0171600.1 hypothetical protein [Candidatus Cloacimonadaceae bacterium]